jgi:hypothetical protein
VFIVGGKSPNAKRTREHRGQDLSSHFIHLVGWDLVIAEWGLRKYPALFHRSLDVVVETLRLLVLFRLVGCHVV